MKPYDSNVKLFIRAVVCTQAYTYSRLVILQINGVNIEYTHTIRLNVLFQFSGHFKCSLFSVGQCIRDRDSWRMCYDKNFPAISVQRETISTPFLRLHIASIAIQRKAQ